MQPLPRQFSAEAYWTPNGKRYRVDHPAWVAELSRVTQAIANDVAAGVVEGKAPNDFLGLRALALLAVFLPEHKLSVLNAMWMDAWHSPDGATLFGELVRRLNAPNE